MKDKTNFYSFISPAVTLAICVAIYLFHDLLAQHLAQHADLSGLRKLSVAGIYYSAAWLAARLIGSSLKRTSPDRRKSPKLLRELITAALFLTATFATVAMLLGQSAGGALASSGLIIAILGFAIRNVLADVFSGIALGLEAPFRIGDWVEFDGTIRGRVIEIGWRTTRLATRNDTYMILPNSQISRQRLTNYSAPRKHYRASVEVILGHDIPVETAKQILSEAAKSTPIIMQSREPDVRTLSYDPEGVNYAIRYWVPSFVDDIDCRDAILMAVDSAIRNYGLTPPAPRFEVVQSLKPRRPIPVAGNSHQPE